LVETFKDKFKEFNTIHFSTLFDAPAEDYGNLNYILRCASEAGKNVVNVALEDIGYQQETNSFKDLNNVAVECLFKLYPLEYLTLDDFAPHLLNNSSIRIVEPSWKLLLSNKLLMAKLWERHVGHPNLLATYSETNKLMKGDFIKKPLLSREGANVSKFTISEGKEQFIHLSGTEFNDDYDKSNYIYQQFVPQFKHDGKNVVIGSWIVGEKSCGIGIREDYFDVIGNNSRFVPHLFK
jgi:glutathionylspermidine synthase